MSIEFSLGEIETEHGRLIDPTVELPVRAAGGYTLFEFLVDSGADYSMLPRRFAELLGVDLSDVPETAVTGVGSSDVATQLGEMTLRVGDTDVTVPCLFSSNENTPYLLGRMGFFSRFNITFDNRRKRTVLESIAP